MFLLLFMTLGYPLILEIYLKMFQKQYNSLTKTFFYKKGKALDKNRSIEPNDPPTIPYDHGTLFGLSSNRNSLYKSEKEEVIANGIS